MRGEGHVPRAVRGPQREQHLPLVATAAAARRGDAGAHGCALTQHRQARYTSIAKVFARECHAMTDYL